MLVELLPGGDGVPDLSPLCGANASTPTAATALENAPLHKRKRTPLLDIDLAAWEELHNDQLAQMPNELLPQSTVHGEHSWTVRNGSCTVEVLFKRKALVVKASSTGECLRRLPWNFKGELDHTWSWLKTEIGWDAIKQ